MTALDQLAAEAIALAGGSHPCAALGHVWKHIGGAWCGCHPEIDGCSVPVHECAVCGDCDYGDNDETDEVRRRCRETWAPELFLEAQS